MCEIHKIVLKQSRDCKKCVFQCVAVRKIVLARCGFPHVSGQFQQ